MREIKFRAWDGQRKKFFTNPLWVEFQVDLKGELTAKNLKAFGKGYQQLKINQYTGLKDKNGVEIYEGDIVKAKDYLTKDNKTYFDDIGIAEFRDGMFTICDDYPTNFKGQIIEVIGNIYENPELIKGN